MVAMTGEMALARSEETINELLLYRRVAWRIMPLAIICFLFWACPTLPMAWRRACFSLATCCSKCPAAWA